MLPVYPYFKMKVFRRSSSCSSGQCDRLSGFYIVSRLDQIFGVMAVNGQHFNPNLVFDLQERKLNNQCLVFTQKGGKIAVKPVELMPHQFAGDYSYSPASCKNKEQIESKKETL